MFDDSYVRNVHESEIVTRDAYVLFYRRRDSQTSGNVVNTNVSNNINNHVNQQHYHQANMCQNIPMKNENIHHDDEFYSCEEDDVDLSDESSETSEMDSENESEDNDVLKDVYTNLNELD